MIEKYDLKAEDWFCYGQWEQPPFSGQYWVHWYKKEVADKIGVVESDHRIIMVNGYTILHKKGFEALKEQLNKAVEEKNENYFKKMLDVSLEGTEEYKKMLHVFEEETPSLELFKKFINSSRNLLVPWYSGAILSDYVGELLTKECDKINFPLAQALTHVPNKETLLIKQLKEALAFKNELKLKNLIGKDKETIKEQEPNLYEKMLSHVKEFDWLGTHHFWGEGLTLNKLLKDIPTLSPLEEENPQGELPESLKFIVKVAGDFAYLRNYPVEIFAWVAYKARPLLSKIGEKLGLTYEELIFLTPDEIINYLETNTQPNKDLIERRKQGVVILTRDGKEIVIDNQEEVKAFLDELTPKHDLSASEFTGVIANPGKAKGRVKVFLVPEDMEKMQQGDILVTTMTTPDFVPLMSKAAAIVTDIGGLLSHAAVVSRELGKPCIIGTELGTKILKDNDLIEVNANEGIVKKI